MIKDFLKLEWAPKQLVTRRRLAFRLVLAAGLVAYATYDVGRRITEVPFMGDEATWILAGNYYTDLLVRGEFTHSSWVANHLLDAGNLNPHLGKVLLGLGIRFHPSRQPGDAEYHGQFDWSKSELQNYREGRLPPEPLLLRARSTAAVFTVGCALLLFLIGTLFIHEVAGILAYVLFLSTDFIAHLLVRAMTDSFYNFFLLCGLLASYGIVRNASNKDLVAYSAWVGLAAALACSVKVIGLPVLALFYVPLWLYVTLPCWPGIRVFLLGPVAFGASAVVPVYVLNPFLWPTESWRMLLEFPRLFTRWKSALTSVQGPFWGDPPERLGRIHHQFFASDSMVFPGERIFLGLGVALCAYFLFRAIRERKAHPLGVLLIYAVAHYGFIVALIQFNWRRYYFPTFMSMKLVAAAGAVVPILLLIQYWKLRGTPAKAIEAGRETARTE